MTADGFSCLRCAQWSRSVFAILNAGSRALFYNDPLSHEPFRSKEKVATAILGLFFIVIYPILMVKSIANIESQPDLHYHQAAFDYNFDWGPLSLGLSGNFLYNFGIQIPLNAHLSPLLGLARALSANHQIKIALLLFFLAMAALLWAAGRLIKLRPVPRIILVGLATLIVTVPVGLEKFVYIVPPYFLTHLLNCGLWWHEASILSLAAVLLFFLLGQLRSSVANLTLGFLFGAICLITLLAFAEGALFIAPIIVFYCLGFLVTSRNRLELLWKALSASLLAVFMVALRLHTFFINLYSYTFGGYFPDLFTLDAATLFQLSNMATALPYDYRIQIFYSISIFTVCCAALLASENLKRLAIAALTCESCIIGLAIINIFLFKADIAFFYLEFLHLPVLVTFFVLFWLILFSTGSILLVQVLDAGCRYSQRIVVASWLSAIRNNLHWAAWAIPIAALARALTIPILTSFHMYPAKEPPSVEIIRDELALTAGEPFRGRLLTLAGMNSESRDQWPGGAGSVLDVLGSQYRVLIGNDHYVNMLPLRVPVANEFGHWTSPLTFIFLRSFFGRNDDVIAVKAMFPLRSYNERIAKLIGVRIVVTDAPNIEGGTLLYETRAGIADLRVYRVSGVNLGQFSPTQSTNVSRAAEVIEALSSPSFNPEREVLVEEQLPLDLVPGRLVSVTTEYGPKLVVKAESAGTSILVLPFEYSYCLQLNVPKSQSARLLPVNLQQVGLLFNANVRAEISYRFGPLDDPHCRQRDLDRIARLRLREVLASMPMR